MFPQITRSDKIIMFLGPCEYGLIRSNRMHCTEAQVHFHISNLFRLNIGGFENSFKHETIVIPILRIIASKLT